MLNTTRIATNGASNRASNGGWRRLLAALALAVAACWLQGSDVSAHAAYQSSSPSFGEVLTQSPSEISVRFTQELFRRAGANSLTLQQVRGDVVDEWDLPEPEIGNEDRHVMRLIVDVELSPGRYVVSWTNLSAEDGDSDSGSYPFYISRQPEDDEIELDRLIAAELLIAYPGDDVKQAEPEVADPSASPTVVRTLSSNDVSLGVGPVIWLMVGLVAALMLGVTLVLRWSRWRRAGQRRAE